jgi:hypothetical protein
MVYVYNELLQLHTKTIIYLHYNECIDLLIIISCKLRPFHVRSRLINLGSNSYLIGQAMARINCTVYWMHYFHSEEPFCHVINTV